MLSLEKGLFLSAAIPDINMMYGNVIAISYPLWEYLTIYLISWINLLFLLDESLDLPSKVFQTRAKCLFEIDA